MSKLDEAMLQDMAYIVIHENRPYCYRDFLRWNDGEKEWRMKHKTFRNKISKLKKDGKAKSCYNSGCAFYTIEGYDFGKAGTPYHTGVTISHNHPIYQVIKNLPVDKQCIHNIRLRFTARNIYETFSLNTTFPKYDVSGDILLPYWNKNNAIVQVRIHKTDTVSIIVGCSLEPFPLDYNGIIRFFTTLASTEALLVGIMLSIYHGKLNQNQSIPDYKKWLITMWHFGSDGLLEYTGEKFSIAVENAQHIVTTIYSKDFGKYNKIRLERQEYPKKNVFDAIVEKLNT
jgi:hypothetical protein